MNKELLENQCINVWRGFTTEEQNTVLNVLHTLTTYYGTGEGETGLCNKIALIPGSLKVIQSCFPLWDDYSGDNVYPIHTDIDQTPEQQYDNAYATKWDNTLYGNERRALCLFLYTTLTNWQVINNV